MNMQRKSAPIVCLATACLAVAAGAAGCGSPAPAGLPRHQSGSSSTRQDSLARIPSESNAGMAPTASSTAPGPSSASRGSRTAALADGLYTDAADGTPHYAIALNMSGDDGISGSVTFLYPDGRTATIGGYTGKLAAGGKLSLIFADRQALAGTYGNGQLTLTGCTSALTWAVKPVGCRFTYHGHVP